ncbi:MAG: delta-60 repeat domain-containing protein [Chloroflexota bacterium]
MYRRRFMNSDTQSNGYVRGIVLILTFLLSVGQPPLLEFSPGISTALAQATPNLQSFTTTTPNGTYGNGDPIEICATYDQVLETGSTMSVTLDTGATLTLNHFDQSIAGNITPDPAFNVGTGANSNVRALAQQTDGKVIISGEFSQYKGATATRIARLNADDALAAIFNTNLGAGQNNYIGRHFADYDGTRRNYIARA